MSRHGRDFDRAQAAYDAQTPYDNEPKMVECPKCEGEGIVTPIDVENVSLEIVIGETVKCGTCEGSGEIPKPPKEEPEWDEGSDR